MAKIAKVEEKHHRIRLMSDMENTEMLLVKGGAKAYVWTGCGTYCGEKTLRKFAQAILRELRCK